ncbi:MAG: glucosaminidase domain-containing protein [Clostridia bacterium]|nr:glucosaminidase domain-containing protein [Clostridia bacterium]
MTKEEFFNTLGNLAVAESNRRIAGGSKFVLPSVCIAQSALETGYGSSSLMTKANAFFGIKAGGSWTGKVFRAGTWEVADGEAYNTTANFRAYDSLQDSVADYYELIINASRYAGGLSTYPDGIKTPLDTITAIWKAGYATDELYDTKVMSIINSNNLTEFDKLVDGKTFDPSYSWTGATSSGGNGSSSIVSGDGTIITGKKIAYGFRKVERIQL